MKVGELSYDTRSREPNTIIVATLDASIGQTNKHSVCQVTLWDVITGVFFFIMVHNLSCSVHVQIKSQIKR